jgi:type II restriction enzyme
MEITEVHKKLGISTADEGFNYLIDTLRPSLKLWDYFVNWDKVFRNTRQIEIQLNIWNYLLGKEDFDVEFDALLLEHPEIVMAIPAMVVRDGSNSHSFAIISSIDDIAADDINFDFSTPAVTAEQRSAALAFVRGTGLIRLFQSDGVKSVVDYVLGVEAGLDSNGRKNRSGTSMEIVVGALIARAAWTSGFEFIEQATRSRIRNEWGFEVPVDKSSRAYDFALSDGTKLVIVETNFYGGGGSKLKATAGEYKGLSNLLTSHGFEFVWITDGAGWRTTKLPLREAFDVINHIWNLNLLNEGCLSVLF